MKKRLAAALAALMLLLSGCTALLEREYVLISPHTATPTAEDDPSVLRAERYQDLVNALVHLIYQGAETGAIRLYLDSQDVEADLEAACQEVMQEDPLGAYAVEDIHYSIHSIVAYSEAAVQITYRRTPEQIRSIVSVTGAPAIRSQLTATLASFGTDCAIRLRSFQGDEADIRALFQEAYYATPASALDLPDLSVTFYPQQGQQCIVEIQLTYHMDRQALEYRRTRTVSACQALLDALPASGSDQRLLAAAQALLSLGGYRSDGGSTPYHALLDGGADSQGLSLAIAMVCQGLGVNYTLVSGSLEEQPHLWLVVSTTDGWRHLDLTADADGVALRTDDQMEALGRSWDRSAVPQCTADSSSGSV